MQAGQERKDGEIFLSIDMQRPEAWISATYTQFPKLEEEGGDKGERKSVTSHLKSFFSLCCADGHMCSKRIHNVTKRQKQPAKEPDAGHVVPVPQTQYKVPLFPGFH